MALRLKPRRASSTWWHWRSRTVLALLWLILTLTSEFWLPQSVVQRCSWPSVPTTNPESVLRIALVADPQIIDAWSYPGRWAALQWVTRVLTDRWEARSWRFVQRALQPAQTYFLGDLFDGGRNWGMGDPQWMQERDRLARLFPPPPQGPVYWNTQGNHDIGFGKDIVPGTPQRFAQHFGLANQVFPLLEGEYDVVVLDTISLSSINRTQVYEVQAQRFLDTYQPTHPTTKVILLTHVPLYRPRGAPCGTERESGRPLPQAKGYQYQTQLSYNLTQEIVHKLNPVLVFSGDDHDACTYTHPPSTVPPLNTTTEADQYAGWRPFGGATEHTIKSFSMAMGISLPGLSLLSLSSQGWNVASCYLGPPYQPYLYYAIAAFACLVIMVPIRYPQRNLSSSTTPRGSPTSSQTSWAWGKSSAGEVLPMHAPQVQARAPSSMQPAQDEAEEEALLPSPVSNDPGQDDSWIDMGPRRWFVSNESWTLTSRARRELQRIGVLLGIDTIVCASAWLTGELVVQRWSYASL